MVCCALYRFDHSDLFLLQDLQFRHIHSDGTVEDAMKSEHLHETIEWCPQWKKKGPICKVTFKSGLNCMTDGGLFPETQREKETKSVRSPGRRQRSVATL